MHIILDIDFLLFLGFISNPYLVCRSHYSFQNSHCFKSAILHIFSVLFHSRLKKQGKHMQRKGRKLLRFWKDLLRER